MSHNTVPSYDINSNSHWKDTPLSEHKHGAAGCCASHDKEKEVAAPLLESHMISTHENPDNMWLNLGLVGASVLCGGAALALRRKSTKGCHEDA